MTKETSTIKQIQKYLGFAINLENIKGEGGLKAPGFTCRYLLLSSIFDVL